MCYRYVKVYSCGHERRYPIKHCIDAPLNRATGRKTVCNKQRTTERVADLDPCPDLDCFLNDLKYKAGHAVDAVRAATEWMAVLGLLPEVCPAIILFVLNVDTLEVC